MYIRVMSSRRPAPKRATNVVFVKAPARAPVRAQRAPARKPRAMTGFGAYEEKKEKKAQPEEGIGAKVGRSIGAGLGAGAEQLIRWITGLGEYQVKKNALFNQDTPLIYNKSKKGGIVIRNREYLRDITTSSTAGAFSISSFPLNPGLDSTFPMLSQIAANYSEYSLEGVIFEFRSMSADALNSTNTALGSVIMATEYDSQLPVFANKSEMENHEFGASCKPSLDMMHPIECAPSQTVATELYIRAGKNPAGSDVRLYDWGRMSIATVGFQGTNVNIGELWVTYQIRLIKPKMFAALGSMNGAYRSTNTAYANATPLGSGTETVVFDTLGITQTAGTQLNFPLNSNIQTYFVSVRWTGTAAAVTYPLVTYSSGVAVSAYCGSTVGPDGTRTAAYAVLNFAVVVQGNTIGFASFGAAGALPTAGTDVSIRVMQIDNAVV